MSYTEILSSELSKQKNVIYKITNLFDDKTYIGQTKKSLLNLDNNLINVFPSITDAEIYIKGKKTGILWTNLSKNNKPYIIINNYKWMLYDKFNKKYRKVEDELS